MELSCYAKAVRYFYAHSSGMHSGDLVKLGGSDLTEVEKGTLLEVMQRAKVYGSTLHYH